MAATYTGMTASKPPISQHPAFPAIVALWFAALLGIGSLVLPVTLFESLAVVTGLSAAIPAAEPPLGVAARILIALVGAGLGALAGLYIARKVVSAQSASRPASHPILRETKSARPAKRPISAHEELGAEGFDEPVENARPAPIPGRRRALSITEESGPSELLDYAPLPGAGAEIALDTADEPAEPENEALDLAAFADPAQAAERPGPADDMEAFEPNHTASAFMPEPTQAPAVEPMPEAPATDQVRPFDAPELTASTDHEPGAVETPADTLREELGLAADPASAPLVDAPVEFETNEEKRVTPAPESADALDTLDERPLVELSITELVDRFALSLQRAAERAEAEPPAAEMPARYVPDLGVEAMEAPRFAAPPAPGPESQEPDLAAATPEYAAPSEVIPAALRPLALDEEPVDEDEDLSLTLSLSREARPFAHPPADSASAHVAGSGGNDESQEAPVEGDYSSLLSIRKPEVQREFVRVEEDPVEEGEGGDGAVEPVVVFPGQEERRAAPATDGPVREPATRPAPAGRPFDAPSSVRAAPVASDAPSVDQAQAERALREALHKLQRLSGAA